MIERNTARAIVIKDVALLVMKRWRRDEQTGEMLHYLSIPGGMVEPGEEPAQTAEREIWEEMKIQVEVGPEVAVVKHGHTRHHYFLGKYALGEPMLDPQSPEAKSMNENNRYEPAWLPLAELDEQNLHPVYKRVLPLIFEIADGNIPSEPWRIDNNHL